MERMTNHSAFSSKPLLLAILVAGSLLPSFGQTQGSTSAPAQAPANATGPTAAPAKPAAPKTGTAPKTATAAKPGLALTTAKQKVSYSIGTDIAKKVGSQFKSQSLDLDPAMLARGFRDAMTGAKLAMTDDQIKATLTEFGAQMQAKRAAANKEAAERNKVASEKNKQEGEAFLAANKGKEGVQVLPSGLQYKILKEGDGKKPLASDTVQCNYRGTLVDGTEFDSSDKHGGPATFQVGGVIKGWTEALQLMPVGSKWQLFIPPDLAYGDRGAGGDIGPGATLIFEVELVSIQDKAADKQ
jgi:FKBP-type peptidyl-prolyl cis-trans isomerase FklB